MDNSRLDALLAPLTSAARSQGLTDAAWAARAGVRPETLSRLRRRDDCDLSTLQALAAPLGQRVGLEPSASSRATDSHFPERFDRDAEAQLLALAAQRQRNPAAWAAAGPDFFMGGLATMLASVLDDERSELLALAERLHPGVTEPAVFATWLEGSPVQPSRFLPMLAKERSRAPA